MNPQRQKNRWGTKTAHILKGLEEKYGIDISCSAESVA